MMPSRNSGYGIAERPKQSRDALNWSTAKNSSVMLLIAGGIYRKTHPKRYKGKPRGRKPIRKNEKFKPPVLSNGDLVTNCSSVADMH